MNSKMIALVLIIVTAVAVVVYPSYQAQVLPIVGSNLVDPPHINPVFQEKPKIEVVFVLDTTGSMSGLIEAAKEKIWSVATTMATAQTAPEIKIGLVAYRDRGDDYVTRTIDLSSDLDTVYARLMDFEAAGGGDGPESVNQALFDAVHNISWSQDTDTYRVVFLVGDAPAHMDYQDDVKYPETVARARKRGIVINAIQSGENGGTRLAWQQIADLGQGNYFQVDQAGSAIAITTPFDKKLAALSAQLDNTRLTFGDPDQIRQGKQKADAIAKLKKEASTESLARRAAFNTSASGKQNLLGESDLVEAMAKGKVDLDTIDESLLPAELRMKAPAARRDVVTTTAGVRAELSQQIRQLSDRRSSYLKEKVDESGIGKESLDDKIYRAVQSQAARVGLVYEAESAEY